MARSGRKGRIPEVGTVSSWGLIKGPQAVRCANCGLENPSGAKFCSDCGAALANGFAAGATPAAPRPTLEVLFGRYQVLEELGEGGMGRVVRVLDTSLHEEVALKLIRAGRAEERITLERFRNEIRLARKIAHPNVCRMFDFAESEGTPYITMEFVRGESLRHLLDRSGKLSPERTIEFALGICRGLAEAHRLGVIHRDLKPQNLMIDDEGEPKILDFGIARSTATSGMTRAGTLVGTPEYMSPEQAEGIEADERSDIYALGVILYEMVVGRPPFVGDTPIAVAMKHKTEPPPRLNSLLAMMPAALARVIVTCLQKRPADRFQDVREILSVLSDHTTPSAALVSRTAELPVFLRQGAPQPETPREAPFAAREVELARLQEFLDIALARRGRVALITGEPGSGKSTLAAEFARRAQEAEPELVVANGRCEAQTGSGDPYRPFRQVLELLTGDIEAPWTAGALTREHATRLWGLIPHAVAALVEYGPSLPGTLLPASSLLRRAAACGGEGQEWFERLRVLVEGGAADAAGLKEAQIQEQYSRVLLSLARRRPLLLVIDDLQWVDSGSANLLVQVGRQIAESPILMIGICRSAELWLGREGERHPMATAVNELKRAFGSIEIELDRAEGRSFLNAYLDAHPNRFTDEFRDALYRQTGGHALFTVELMRSLIERSLLAQDADGIWHEAAELDWPALPTRTEGVVGERIDRVRQELREILDMASVEGEEFTAELVARVLGTDERKVVKALSGELDKRHRLVKAVGIRRTDGQRLSQYRFRNLLFRRYLYEGLDEVERSYHHEEVGSALEALYGEAKAGIAIQLAEHFEIAGNADKAVDYRRQAGNDALRLAAFKESVGHFKKGIDLLESLLDDGERRQRELDLRLSLASGLIATEGYGSGVLERNYHRIEELCDRPEESPRGKEILYRLWGFHFIRSHRRETGELAEQLHQLTARDPSPSLRMTADMMLGITRFYEGNLTAAAAPLTRAAESFDPEKHAARLVVYANDPAFDAWLYQAWCSLLRGEPGRAWALLKEARSCAKQLGDPFAVAEALCFEAAIGCDLGLEPRAVLAAARECVETSQEQGFPFWLAHSHTMAGWAAVLAGEGEDGVAEIQDGLRMAEEIGTEVPYGAELVHLADAYRELGQVDAGLRAVDRALQHSAKSLDRFYDAEAQRVKGELLLLDGGDSEQAEACFREALRISRKQGSRMFELLAATSLGRLLVGQGRGTEAHGLLQSTCAGFAQDLESRHLDAARALLAQSR